MKGIQYIANIHEIADPSICTTIVELVGILSSQIQQLAQLKMKKRLTVEHLRKAAVLVGKHLAWHMPLPHQNKIS